MNKAKTEYLDVEDFDSYIHLLRLATSPMHQRHGAGTALTKWGINLANKYDVAIGLFATSMGEPLYAKLGFQSLAKPTAQVEGEDEKVTMTIMRLEPKKRSEK